MKLEISPEKHDVLSSLMSHVALIESDNQSSQQLWMTHFIMSEDLRYAHKCPQCGGYWLPKTESLSVSDPTCPKCKENTVSDQDILLTTPMTFSLFRDRPSSIQFNDQLPDKHFEWVPRTQFSEPFVIEQLSINDQTRYCLIEGKRHLEQGVRLDDPM